MKPELMAGVTEAIAAFRTAADHRDAGALDAVLATDFRVVFAVGDGATTTLPRGQFLEQVRAGKIGGADRTLAVGEVQHVGGFATAVARMERPDARFDGFYTLVQDHDQWRLLQEVVRMTPRAR